MEILFVRDDKALDQLEHRTFGETPEEQAIQEHLKGKGFGMRTPAVSTTDELRTLILSGRNQCIVYIHHDPARAVEIMSEFPDFTCPPSCFTARAAVYSDGKTSKGRGHTPSPFPCPGAPFLRT